MKRFPSIHFLWSVFFAINSIAVELNYPRYRYIVTPLARITELRDLHANVPFPEHASLHFQIVKAPGTHATTWLVNVSLDEYEKYLSEKAPAFDGPEATKLSVILKQLKPLARSPELAIPLIQHLAKMIGMVRTLFIVEGLEIYPLPVLQAIAGVKPDPSNEVFLSLRRFGVMRHRGPKITQETFNGIPKSIEYMLRPLVPDPRAHLVVGDVQTAFLAKTLPTPIQFFPDVRMSEFFNVENKSVLVPFQIGSNEAHDLSERAYIAQITRGRRHVSKELLASLKTVARSLNLTRMFFYIIEDYLEERPLQTLSFIDGGTTEDDFYALPADQRFKSIHLREMFPNERLFEVHGLAFDPDVKNNAQLDINTEAWAAQVVDFIQNGGHHSARFVVQAHPTAAQFYQNKMGLTLIEESQQSFDGEVVLLHETGKIIVERILKLFPHLEIVISPELPNRLNRRHPNALVDSRCMEILKRMGTSDFS